MLFTDKRRRKIEIEVEGDFAVARHKGREVGRVDTSGRIEIDRHQGAPTLAARIVGMEVNPEYRRAGIGTALVEGLAGHLGVLTPGAKDNGMEALSQLLPDELAATRHWQRLGLVGAFDDEMEPVSD